MRLRANYRLLLERCRLEDPAAWHREQQLDANRRGQTDDCYDILSGDYGDDNANLLEIVLAGMVAD